MANYLTELSWQNTTYTIKDTEAHKTLQSKADLVNGVLSDTQIPYSVLYDKRTVDTLLSAKVDKSALDQYSTEAAVIAKVNNMLLTFKTNTIEPYVLQVVSELPTITYINDTIKEAVDDLVTQNTFDVFVSEVRDDYATINAMHELFESFEKPVLDYITLRNKPAINGKQLQGSLTLKDLGIVIKDPPTKLSELENDEGFIITEQDPLYQADRAKLATIDFVFEQLAQSKTPISYKQPIHFYKDNVVDNKLTIDITKYPYISIAAVSIITSEGELFVPLHQAEGITKIIKASQTTDNGLFSYINLYFGEISNTWTQGYVYLNQMVVASAPEADTYDIANQILYITDNNLDAMPNVSENILTLQEDNTTTLTITDGVLDIIVNK